MSLLKTIGAIANHPLNQKQKAAAILRFVKWQIGTRLVPGPVVISWIDGTRVVVRRGDHGMTQNIYCGLADFHDMGYLLHVLTPQDIFVDIGANVGSYTLLACGARGARGYCFEPVPSTFRNLERNLAINLLFPRVTALNLGLADEDGELVFTAGENATNHVAAAGEASEGTIRVPVRRLDSVLDGECPALMKIDVEGYETPVIAGANNVLSNPRLHSVIMELNGSGQRYGHDEQKILQKMVDYGFSTYDYDPLARKLVALGGKNRSSGNTLFIRDIDRVQALISKATRRSIHSIEF